MCKLVFKDQSVITYLRITWVDLLKVQTPGPHPLPPTC